MIDTKNLASKPLQNLLRDKIRLLNNMKDVATSIWIDVWSGKWMFKFEHTKLPQTFVDKWFPENYPERLCRLFEVLDLYIECRKYNAPVQETPVEQCLFAEFRALEKKLLDNNNK